MKELPKPSHRTGLQRRSVVLGPSVAWIASLAGCGSGDEPDQQLDAIQVTSVSPSSAPSGAFTEFTIRYSYSLSTTKEATVHIILFPMEGGTIYSGPVSPVNQGTGSGTLQFSMSPFILTAANSLGLGVGLTAGLDTPNSKLLATDRRLIGITA